MSSVICPFCFRAHDFRAELTCPETSFEVPEVYVSEYRQRPPLWLMTVGFKRHGKTCYVAALTQVLEGMQVWSSGYFIPIDEFTFGRMRQIHDQAAGGDLPAGTPAERPRPLLFQARGLPGIESRCVVIYDIPGESFDQFERVTEFAPVMRAVQTTWFFVSLRDLQEADRGRTIQELFSVYRAGMRRLRIPLRGRSLIVVFTKFDQEDEPRVAREYLASDPLLRAAEERPDLEEYRSRMRKISEELGEFTRVRVRGGAGFINMARDAEMEVVFTVTSALGQDPAHGGRLAEAARPARVLDPYLWAADLEVVIGGHRLFVALEPSGDRSPLSRDDVVALWHRLGGFAEVVVHFLGRAEPTGVSGEAPPAAPPAVTPRLVGPLFEEMAPADRLLILTAGPLLDLDDFPAAEWRDRVLIVSTADRPIGGKWQELRYVESPAQLVESPARLDEVAERFLRLV